MGGVAKNRFPYEKVDGKEGKFPPFTQFPLEIFVAAVYKRLKLDTRQVRVNIAIE